MKLQYQICTGTWIDVPKDRIDEFLNNCEKNNGADINGNYIHPETRRVLPRCVDETVRDLTRNEVFLALELGKTLRNDPADWYSNCRDGEYYDRRMAEMKAAASKIELVKCNCGHTIPKTQVMSASMGTSCPDCYDNMS